MCDLKSAAFALALTLGLTLLPPAIGAERAVDPGFAQGQRLIDIVGEDHVRLRVTLPRALLVALAGADEDEDLGSVVSGLESIYAVVLDLGDPQRAERARKAVRDVEAGLRSKDWEELAFVQEEGATVRVLVRMEGDRVRGLVVLVIDTSDDEPTLVFANVTGTIDLARLQELGRGLDVPGLSELKDLEKKK